MTLSLPHDNALLEAEISEHGAGLVVIDPLMSVMGERTDTHREREVRKAGCRKAARTPAKPFGAFTATCRTPPARISTICWRDRVAADPRRRETGADARRAGSRDHRRGPAGLEGGTARRTPRTDAGAGRHKPTRLGNPRLCRASPAGAPCRTGRHSRRGSGRVGEASPAYRELATVTLSYPLGRGSSPLQSRA